MTRWISRLITALMLLMLLTGAGAIAGAAWVDTQLHRARVLLEYPDRPTATRGTTWLLVGSDSRDDLTPEQQARLSTGGDVGDGRTDTILLIHLPAGAGKPTLVSIPRDSYVPIPGYGRDKINAAYAWGGAPLLAQTVEQATGLRLTHYGEVGFGGFAGLIDAIGGVRVCLDEPIADPLAGIDLPAGCQWLDGSQALGYSRSRATPRADLDRMIHQRLLLAAVMHRLAEPAVWGNPWRWWTASHAGIDALSVDTDDHVWDVARLAWALRGPVTTLTVPIGELTGSDVGSVVVWDHQRAAELFDALAADAPVPTFCTEIDASAGNCE